MIKMLSKIRSCISILWYNYPYLTTIQTRSTLSRDIQLYRQWLSRLSAGLVTGRVLAICVHVNSKFYFTYLCWVSCTEYVFLPTWQEKTGTSGHMMVLNVLVCAHARHVRKTLGTKLNRRHQTSSKHCNEFPHSRYILDCKGKKKNLKWVGV